MTVRTGLAVATEPAPIAASIAVSTAASVVARSVFQATLIAVSTPAGLVTVPVTAVAVG